MNGSQIVLCSLADEELFAVFRDYGFEPYKDVTEVPVKEIKNIRVILGGSNRKGQFEKIAKPILCTIEFCRDEWI